MRYKFNEIFTENLNGTLSPIRPIRVGGVTVVSGVPFDSHTTFWGVNFYQFKGHDMEADDENGILVIHAIY